MSPINGSGASDSGSAENVSSGSNNQTSSASRGNANNAITVTMKSFKPPRLTESLLNRHNEDMEKLMMQKHRELRSSIKNSDKLKDSRIKTEISGADQGSHYVNQGHGIKRSGSHSWEGDSCKVRVFIFKLSRDEKKLHHIVSCFNISANKKKQLYKINTRTRVYMCMCAQMY